MCGIVGYIGPQDATPIILNGLKRLEYRGYDSAGLAVYQRRQDRGPARCGQVVAPDRTGERLTHQRRAGHRSYALGNAWRAFCAQCPSPPGRVRAGGGRA